MLREDKKHRKQFYHITRRQGKSPLNTALIFCTALFIFHQCYATQHKLQVSWNNTIDDLTVSKRHKSGHSLGQLVLRLLAHKAKIKVLAGLWSRFRLLTQLSPTRPQH